MSLRVRVQTGNVRVDGEAGETEASVCSNLSHVVPIVPGLNAQAGGSHMMVFPKVEFRNARPVSMGPC